MHGFQINNIIQYLLQICHVPSTADAALDSLTSLQTLTDLNLANNALAEFPAQLCHLLTSLQCLNLAEYVYTQHLYTFISEHFRKIVHVRQ